MYSSVWHGLLTLCIWFTSIPVSVLTPMPPGDILSKHRTLIRSWSEILAGAELLLLAVFYSSASYWLAVETFGVFPYKLMYEKPGRKLCQSHSNSNGILKTTSILYLVQLLLSPPLHLLMAWLTSVELLHTLLRSELILNWLIHLALIILGRSNISRFFMYLVLSFLDEEKTILKK